MVAAPRWRLIAGCLDGFAIFLALGIGVLAWNMLQIPHPADWVEKLITIAIVVLVLARLWSRGNSLGKLCCWQRLVDTGTGLPPSYKKAALRALFVAMIIFGGTELAPDTKTSNLCLPFLWVALIYGYGLFDKKSRGLHDLIFGTEVIYTDPKRVSIGGIKGSIFDLLIMLPVALLIAVFMLSSQQ